MRIEYESTVLDNGLKVLVHTDNTTPLVCFNLLYDVGSKDENPEQTGLAHLFEHLMFSGSRHVKDYDEVLDRAGGTNNAFTNNDFTDFYISLPKENLETAFFVESDRMRHLMLTRRKLRIQKDVVIEEFKERVLNKPYGDVDMLVRPLAYKQHPYAWATIGKEIGHIESVSLRDAKRFYHTYYAPDNAVLSVAGPVTAREVFGLAQKWFGSVKRGNRPARTWADEPEQCGARKQTVERNVPSNALYKAWHMPARTSKEFYVFDLISDVLSNGESTRFYTRLVKEKKLFSSLNAYVSGDMENGLFFVCGIMEDGVGFEQAEEAVNREIELLCTESVDERELEKVKNKMETSLVFSNMKGMDKAMNLGYFELMGSARILSGEVETYRAVTAEDIKHVAAEYLKEEKASTLYYKKSAPQESAF